MARDKKQPEPEQEAGAPEWMVTFSDCMTLLLTFFVLLLSFSSFDDKDDFRKMNSSFAEQFSFGNQGASEDDSVVLAPTTKPDIYWGSEKPTSSDGTTNSFKKKTDPKDFLRYQTFMVSSQEIFWGKGTAISANGKKVLTDLASFLSEFPGYFVIVSESGPQDEKGGESIGFDRSWAVFNYMMTEKGLSPGQLNISAAGTAVKEYHANQTRQGQTAANERMLEIVLLRRSI
jgi:chemotaxis protein MotB